jgi:hypothetical protein
LVEDSLKAEVLRLKEQLKRNTADALLLRKSNDELQVVLERCLKKLNTEMEEKLSMIDRLNAVYLNSVQFQRCNALNAKNLGLWLLALRFVFKVEIRNF